MCMMSCIYMFNAFLQITAVNDKQNAEHNRQGKRIAGKKKLEA